MKEQKILGNVMNYNIIDLYLYRLHAINSMAINDFPLQTF